MNKEKGITIHDIGKRVVLSESGKRCFARDTNKSGTLEKVRGDLVVVAWDFRLTPQTLNIQFIKLASSNENKK